MPLAMRLNKGDELSSEGVHRLSKRPTFPRQTQLPLGVLLPSLNLLESPVVEWSFLHFPGGGGLGAGQSASRCPHTKQSSSAQERKETRPQGREWSGRSLLASSPPLTWADTG